LRLLEEPVDIYLLTADVRGVPRAADQQGGSAGAAEHHVGELLAVEPVESRIGRAKNEQNRIIAVRFPFPEISGYGLV
jgi:hypothetical protein